MDVRQRIDSLDIARGIDGSPGTTLVKVAGALDKFAGKMRVS